MNENRLPEILTSLREVRDMTQDELGTSLGVSGKTVSKWETGSSMPDVAMLCTLADFFGVETDVLLGRKNNEKRTVRDALLEEIDGLDSNGTALKIFEAVCGTAPVSFGRLMDDVTAVPTKENRCAVTRKGFFAFNVSSDDVSAAVMLMRSRSNFAFLSDKASLGKTAELLSLLGDADALRICAFIHSTACSESFTADCASRMTGVPADKAAEILERYKAVGLCTSETAHLKDGTVMVYESYGDGLFMSIISLAYEYMCGAKRYDYNWGGTFKIIEGYRGAVKEEK